MKKLVSLTVAISDTSVSTAIVVREYARKQDPDSVKPTIKTYRTKSFNPEHKEITSEYLEDRLKVLLRSIIKETRFEDLQKAGITVRDISKIAVSLSAPWFEGKTVTSHFEEAKEFKVTQVILDKAFDSEIKAISGNDKEIVSILESNILGATLNGYAISNPVGKLATSLTLTGYVSYTKTSVKNLIEEVLDSCFHHVDEVIINSEPTILLAAAIEEAKLMNLQTDFAIIRVNEILTHIQIIRNQHIRELGTVPIGLNAILKEISEACSVTFEVALNVMELFLEKKLESDLDTRISTAITKTLEAWRAGIKEFSIRALSTGRFPANVFLSSATVVSQALKDHLLEDDYLDVTMSEKKLTVEILDRSTLNNFLEIDKANVKVEPGFLTKLNAMI